jgi:hypothetical protein
MTSESLEELRARLLRDENVQKMIRARAFEIFRMRGLQPGGPAQDWFQAESEVLAFLLANQPEHATEPEHTTKEEGEQISVTSTNDVAVKRTPAKKRKSRPVTKDTSAKKVATRRTSAKKPVKAESKPKRARKESKSEDKTA